MLFRTLGNVRMLTIALAMAATNTGYVQAQSADEYGICIGPNRVERKLTCLVDGDTGWEHGKKWRLESVDTPEYKQHAQCAAEIKHAKAATVRVLELMRAGYAIAWVGKRGKGGRDLVRIKLSDGRDLGDILLSEGLAQPWPNNTNPWCD